MRVFFNDLFVYCVSEEHTNILMWSHYADKHRGAVIKFKCINEIDNIFLAANRVKYCEQFPTFGNREEWISYIKGGSGISAPHFYNEVLHSKSRHWEYELEWRIVVPMKEKAGEDYAYSKFCPEEIPEIYIGCEMSPENKNNLITLIRTKFPNTKIFEGIKSKKKFQN